MTGEREGSFYEPDGGGVGGGFIYGRAKWIEEEID
jgi:hypothetical protein